MVYYFPPDYESDREWWLAQRLAGALPRATTLEGLIAFLIVGGLLIGFILVKLLLLALRRLWDIYRSRARGATLSGRTLQYAGVALLATLVLALFLGSRPNMAGTAFIVFAAALLVFTLISEVVDWYIARNEPPPAELPENISLRDVIAWKNEVEHPAADTLA